MRDIKKFIEVSQWHPRAIPVLVKLLEDRKPKSILELGFWKGGGSLIMAATMESYTDSGCITSIDLSSARSWDPSLDKLLNQEPWAKDIITPVFSQHSSGYIWEMKKMIEQGADKYDMVCLDGAHTLVPDGLAFFMADKLLKPGGVFFVDDLTWKIKNWKSFPKKKAELMQVISKEEANTDQVLWIWKYLIGQHPDYYKQKVIWKNNGIPKWGIAEKKG